MLSQVFAKGCSVAIVGRPIPSPAIILEFIRVHHSSLENIEYTRRYAIEGSVNPFKDIHCSILISFLASCKSSLSAYRSIIDTTMMSFSNSTVGASLYDRSLDKHTAFHFAFSMASIFDCSEATRRFAHLNSHRSSSTILWRVLNSHQGCGR